MKRQNKKEGGEKQLALIFDHPQLHQLCWFLNLEKEELNLRLTPEDVFLNTLALDISARPGLAKRLYDELRRDLLPIIAPQREYRKREAQYVLRELVRKIDWMNFTYRRKLIHEADNYGRKPELYPVRLEPRYPILGHKWRVLSRASSSNVGPLYSSLYEAVIEVIETGELSLLKLCSVCQKFFTQLHGRQSFCSDRCRNEFNNRRRLDSGYFNKLRWDKRRRDIAKAKRLLQEGKSVNKVSAQLGLSLRILRKESLI